MRCRENKNEYGYYIPIIKTIENLLRNPEVVREKYKLLILRLGDYYIPIIKTIENLLRNPEVVTEIQAPHTQVR